ncbi:MAG: CBS domain-containing protein [Deltaproteobacteria bacterium]|nr:CBS domain-containing protein [Deltaproteobacteria bacterium]
MDIITTHVNADFDCLGGMIAAKKLYPDAEMVFAGGQERSLREFFLKSAIYAYDFKRIKEIDLNGVKRLVLVDVHHSGRIGPFGAVAMRPDVEIHLYDHHVEGQGDLRGTVEHIEAVGATVTVFAEIFLEKGIRPTPDEATMMMLGLYEDTNSLLSTSTTQRDYQAAAFLLSCGANLNTVSDFLTRELTAEQVALLHQLLRSLTMVYVHGLEIGVAHASTEDYAGDIAVLAHKVQEMKSLDALVIAVRMAGRIFLVGRSRLAEIPMGEILAEFGGGGHGFAASAAVRELTLIQVLERLPLILESHVRRGSVAADIMSTPVRSLDEGVSIGQAREILNRYNLNAMPVVRKAIVLGIVTRQLVDKAFYHGLAAASVKEYMSTEFVSVRPDTPIRVLQELLLEGNQRFFPVISEGQLTGALTRTDLLRQLVSGAGLFGGGHKEGSRCGEKGFQRKQLSRLLRLQLPAERIQLLRRIGEVGDHLGMSVFVVGGFARDLLLRKENFDIDIVVDGDGIAFAEEFRRRHQCRVRGHEKFRTAVIIFPDNYKIDVASARLEYYLEPGALPQVEYATIKIDLYRRDFTINTLAITLNPGQFGELLDFFGGQRDLREGTIRVLHNLSFVEDPTRIFRAIRLEQRLAFRISQDTESLLRSAVREGFLNRVSGGRLLNELIIILKESDPLPALKRMTVFDVFKFLHPSLNLSPAVIDVFGEAFRAINWYELLFLDEKIYRWQVLFLCLTCQLDDDAMQGVCSRFAIPKNYRKLLTTERKNFHYFLRHLEWRCERGESVLASEIVSRLKPLPLEMLLYGMALAKGEGPRRLLAQFISQWRNLAPELRGKDLVKLGYRPGIIFQRILKALLDAKLDGWVSGRNEEIDFVKRMFPTPEG